MRGWIGWTLFAFVAWTVVSVVVGIVLAYAFGRLDDTPLLDLDEDATVLPLTRAVGDEREQEVVSLASARARRQDAGQARARRSP
jgi:hypothetical protein